MSGQRSGGRASGGKGSGGIGMGFGGGDRTGGRRGRSGEREHSGGVSILPAGSEVVAVAESGAGGPMQGGWFTPSGKFQWRSGASENDIYFSPPPKGDRAAPPAPAPGPAGRISGGLTATKSPAVAPLAPQDLADRRMDAVAQTIRAEARQVADKFVDKVASLRKEANHHAAVAAEKEKILGDKEENIKLLQDQLAAAMSQLRTKDSTIEVQKQTIQALATPGGSQAGESSPSMSTGSLDITPGRRRGERNPLPARPAGPIPSLTPQQRRQLRLTPNRADDVFAERTMTPTPNPMAMVVRDYPRSLQELLSACFNHVEAAIRQVPVLDLVPRKNGRPTYKQMEIITLLQGHLDTKQLAFDMLKEDDGRVYAITALMCHTLVDTIFTEQIIGYNSNFGGSTYLAAFNDERKAAEYGHPRIRDFAYRNSLAEQRASAARAIVREPGFWKWVNSITYNMTKNIVRDYAVCFPDRVTYTLTQELHRAVSEAVRLTVRMRQEPSYIEYNFPPTGTPWHLGFHVHRNPELMGQTLRNEKEEYGVRIAIMPLIKSKSFANNNIAVKTIHKAEVVVGDRDVVLREARKQK